MTGGMELNDLEGPFQSKPFHDSVLFQVRYFSHRTFDQKKSLPGSEEYLPSLRYCDPLYYELEIPTRYL